MRWTVAGAEERTGEGKILTIEAANQAAAERLARVAGILVAAVEPADAVEVLPPLVVGSVPPVAPAPAIVNGSYALIGDQILNHGSPIDVARVRRVSMKTVARETAGSQILLLVAALTFVIGMITHVAVVVMGIALLIGGVISLALQAATNRPRWTVLLEFDKGSQEIGPFEDESAARAAAEAAFRIVDKQHQALIQAFEARKGAPTPVT